MPGALPERLFSTRYQKKGIKLEHRKISLLFFLFRVRGERCAMDWLKRRGESVQGEFLTKFYSLAGAQ